MSAESQEPVDLARLCSIREIETPLPTQNGSLLPSWLYLFYPLLGRGSMPIGWLYIKIVDANGLPGVTTNGLGQEVADPYTTLQLTGQVSEQNSVLKDAYETVHSTKMIQNSLAPYWNEAFCLAVYRLSAILKLKVFHKRQVANTLNVLNTEDPLLGSVDVPMTSLIETTKAGNALELSLPMSGASLTAQIKIEIS